ncbi:hypothetical protein ILUMI_27103 [Ignelater luminosus]|uniref:Ran-GTPase activating protein 1 C-terminal domain-containing protein n=1 Tax=Ignelater luminosus TaxID=2038154 RepID=A0A8K0C3R9_IGNLU|nr:hypothetical protein ILUMI_27103 [Ignelater luminosus]
MSNMASTTTVDDLTAALESTKVTPSGVSFQGKSLKLDKEEDAQVIVDAITNFKDLEFLNLEGNTLGVDAAKAIAKALENHSKLKRALWKDMFTGRMKTEIPKALEYLGDGLVKAGARLTELDLSDNAFGPIGVQGLASLLRSSSCYALEELRLNNNGLGIGGGKLLAGALMDCYNSSKVEGKPLALKVFIAGRNRLENDGAKALAQVFKTIGTLEEIAMPQNGIYHVGISALSDAFMHNTNLQILNLNDNTIGPHGAQAIAKALPILQNLKIINFGDCLLKTKGALSLADALSSSHTELEELVLGFNEIRSEGGIALANAMVNKNKLKSLILDGNQFNDEVKTKIKDKLKEIGKINALGSLDECESEEDGSEEEGSGDESGESEEEGNTFDDKSKITIIENKPLDPVIGIGSYESFIKASTMENFLNLGNNKEDLILAEIKKNPDLYLDNLVLLIMKVSSLITEEQVSKAALNCSEFLYKELFTWAQKNNKISLVNNALLVHLGLIKSEDKKFKPTWKLEGCLSVLEHIVKQNYVPEFTKETLRVFMGRQVIELNDSLN